jgi:hypothetical protein
MKDKKNETSFLNKLVLIHYLRKLILPCTGYQCCIIGIRNFWNSNWLCRSHFTICRKIRIQS